MVLPVLTLPGLNHPPFRPLAIAVRHLDTLDKGTLRLTPTIRLKHLVRLRVMRLSICLLRLRSTCRVRLMLGLKLRLTLRIKVLFRLKALTALLSSPTLRLAIPLRLSTNPKPVILLNLLSARLLALLLTLPLWPTVEGAKPSGSSPKASAWST